MKQIISVFKYYPQSNFLGGTKPESIKECLLVQDDLDRWLCFIIDGEPEVFRGTFRRVNASLTEVCENFGVVQYPSDAISSEIVRIMREAENKTAQAKRLIEALNLVQETEKETK